MLMRKNEKIYIWFCETFISEVLGMGSRRFLKESQYKKLSDLVTVSDEAFALICFKNYYNSIYNEIKNKETAEPNCSNINNEVKPLYTQKGAMAKKTLSYMVYVQWME